MNDSYEKNPLDQLEETIKKVKQAQIEYAKFSQEKVDEIFRKAALVANAARITLAKMAVEETGMGIVEDKVIKNHFAAEYIYNRYKDSKTCGIVEEDRTNGIKKIAEPIGVIAGVVPTTNPTSTTIFKALLSLKTRNGIIFSPHPRAKRATAEAARIVLKAAVEAGAPANLIACIENPTVELSQALMQNKNISIILATGGPGMVKAAYSCGKPAIGVGAGNTPAVVDETADIKMAVNSILLSKTFDNGVICASEQSIIAVDNIYDQLKIELLDRGAYLLNDEEKAKVSSILLKDGALNAAIVGQPAYKIAELAGITLPTNIKVLIGEVTEISEEEPFAYEKLSPVLALYWAKDYREAVDKAVKLVDFGGSGHTSVLYTNPKNQDRVEYFGEQVSTGRVLVNMPASQGAIGDVYNFRLEPSLTLGCGSWGGNSTSENVGVKHLLNIKTVAERRENMLWFRVPPKIYFKQGCLSLALEDLKGKKKAFIITDKPLYDLGLTTKVTDILDKIDIKYETYFDIEPDPKISTVNRVLEVINKFEPDVIIALGGGSPIDAAKIVWLLYEHPELKFEDLALRFMDIRKRIYKFPELGKKASMIAIPTTSGTGSEVTPFAVITDDETHIKYPIADYALTPNMAIVDPELVMTMPKSLASVSGVDALTHALEAYASAVSSDFTNGLALEALELIFEYLPASYKTANPEAREKIHYASTIAGMAFSNAFLGLCHSMAHKLGAAFDLPHGMANALLISQVIRYNASECPTKQCAFPQYKYPNAKARYAKIASFLELNGETADDKIDKLIEAIENLKKQIDIPSSIKEAGVTEAIFYEKLDEIVELAFDDQCTGANPRYPLMSEIKELYIKAFNGDIK
ncbi:MAG: bifunctional acetaldehyde-CoA/alcohol dehydrogenase [bacterium]